MNALDDGTRDEIPVESVEVPWSVAAAPWVAPGADPADGLFNVVVVGAMSRIETLTFSWRIRSGDHLRSPAVSIRRSRTLTLRALDDWGRSTCG